MTNNNYKTATDIAEAVGLSRQAIYHYEKLGLIKPAIKTDKITLYTPETIDRVNKIRELGKKHKLSYIKELLDKKG